MSAAITGNNVKSSGVVQKMRHVPLYTWVLDLWPESLTAAGGINNQVILGFFNWFVKSEYKNSDKILTSSRGFDQSILQYGDYLDKIIYFHSGVMEQPIYQIWLFSSRRIAETVRRT